MFKNTYFEKHLPAAASDFLRQLQNSNEQLLLYWLFFLSSDDLSTGYEQLVEQLKARKWRKSAFFSGKATFWILWCFKPSSFKKSPLPYFLSQLDGGLNSVEFFI